jgi:hypothetical protein
MKDIFLQDVALPNDNSTVNDILAVVECPNGKVVNIYRLPDNTAVDPKIKELKERAKKLGLL